MIRMRLCEPLNLIGYSDMIHCFFSKSWSFNFVVSCKEGIIRTIHLVKGKEVLENICSHPPPPLVAITNTSHYALEFVVL